MHYAFGHELSPNLGVLNSYWNSEGDLVEEYDWSNDPAMNQNGFHYMGYFPRSTDFYLGSNAWEMVNLVNKQGAGSPADLWPIFRGGEWWDLLKWEKETFLT